MAGAQVRTSSCIVEQPSSQLCRNAERLNGIPSTTTPTQSHKRKISAAQPISQTAKKKARLDGPSKRVSTTINGQTIPSNTARDRVRPGGASSSQQPTLRQSGGSIQVLNSRAPAYASAHVVLEITDSEDDEPEIIPKLHSSLPTQHSTQPSGSLQRSRPLLPRTMPRKSKRKHGLPFEQWSFMSKHHKSGATPPILQPHSSDDEIQIIDRPLSSAPKPRNNTQSNPARRRPPSSSPRATIQPHPITAKKPPEYIILSDNDEIEVPPPSQTGRAVAPPSELHESDLPLFLEPSPEPEPQPNTIPAVAQHSPAPEVIAFDTSSPRPSDEGPGVESSLSRQTSIDAIELLLGATSSPDFLSPRSTTRSPPLPLEVSAYENFKRMGRADKAADFEESLRTPKLATGSTEAFHPIAPVSNISVAPIIGDESLASITDPQGLGPDSLSTASASPQIEDSTLIISQTGTPKLKHHASRDQVEQKDTPSLSTDSGGERSLSPSMGSSPSSESFHPRQATSPQKLDHEATALPHVPSGANGKPDVTQHVPFCPSVEDLNDGVKPGLEDQSSPSPDPIDLFSTVESFLAIDPPTPEPVRFDGPLARAADITQIQPSISQDVADLAENVSTSTLPRSFGSGPSPIVPLPHLSQVSELGSCTTSQCESFQSITSPVPEPPSSPVRPYSSKQRSPTPDQIPIRQDESVIQRSTSPLTCTTPPIEMEVYDSSSDLEYSTHIPPLVEKPTTQRSVSPLPMPEEEQPGSPVGGNSAKGQKHIASVGPLHSISPRQDPGDQSDTSETLSAGARASTSPSPVANLGDSASDLNLENLSIRIRGHPAESANEQLLGHSGKGQISGPEVISTNGVVVESQVVHESPSSNADAQTSPSMHQSWRPVSAATSNATSEAPSPVHTLGLRSRTSILVRIKAFCSLVPSFSLYTCAE